MDRPTRPPSTDASRPTRVFHRFPKAEMPSAVAGEGPYIFDDAGRRYIDGSCGAAVSCLGHSHPTVIAAIQEAVGTLAFAHTSFFTNPYMEELADVLAESAPGDLNHVYFLSGGSEAIEAALKLARQYYVERGMPERARIISRRQSYHGNTLGALSAGGNIWRRAMFEPILIDVEHVSPCYAYRGRKDGESEEEYGVRLGRELEETILAAGPETVMCFLAETVGGATIGAVPAVEGYFREVRRICDKYDVLLILDEVMCGMGRTGTLFAFEQEGIAPDLVTMAKGISAGYQPLGAVMATDRVFDAIVGGSGFFQHGHTYTGHIAACAAGLAVQTALKEENLLQNVATRADQLREKLLERFGNHRHVGDIRGRGLMMSLEFVSDRTTKAPFDPKHGLAMRLKKTALKNGLISYPMGGLIDGRAGDHVMLAPPFIVEEAHLDEIVDKLGRSVDEVLAEISA